MIKTIILDLDVSFTHVKFQVSKMKRSEVTAVSADDVFAAIVRGFDRTSGPCSTEAFKLTKKRRKQLF